MGNNSMSATGGTGSGYHAKIVIDQAGYYTVSCGTGGVSYGAGRAGSAQTQPTNGGASALVRKADGKTIVSAGGGTKGQTWINGGSAGSAGVLSKMSGLVEDTVYVSTNGKNGSYKHTENNNTVNGQNGPISGKTWGSTGYANGSPGGGRVGSAHHGFIWIKYVGNLPVMVTLTINSTPNDAQVVLICGSYSQTGNSITVPEGSVVNYTVSRSGYTTQSGTYTVTSDYTLSVELEELSGLPVWKFTRSNSLPVLLAGEYTTNGLMAQAAINITAISGTIGTSGSTVSCDSNGTSYTLSHIGNETIDGKEVYIYRRSYSFIGATVYDFGYVLPESTVGSVMLYCGLISTSSRPKVTNLTSTSCSWNGNTWTRQDYEGTWTNSGLDPTP